MIARGRVLTLSEREALQIIDALSASEWEN